MSSQDVNDLRIPKTLRPVVLWVHPEGRVVGSLFVRPAEPGAGAERPIDVLNRNLPFIVLQREEPDEIRFYHRASIVRVEHREEAPPSPEGKILHRCQLHMMDGTLFEGTLIRPSPPDRSRLFDFLNREAESFLEIFLDEGLTVLVNKSYILFVRSPDDGPSGR